MHRVEAIASSSSLDVDFSSLRTSIDELQRASAALDNEKVEAEKELRSLIKRITRRRLIRRKIHKVICKVKKIFGKKCWSERGETRAITEMNAPYTRIGHGVRPRVGLAPVWMREQRKSDKKRRHLHKRLMEAVKRVRAVNKKLVAFERGLISEEGIKDREWYKHLGVAPGKWLGACYERLVRIYG